MIVVAAMAWYDERPDMLAAAVSSLDGVADVLVAFDGAYAAYPGGRVISPLDQHNAILRAAERAGIAYHVVNSAALWADQAAKRAAMMRYASQLEDADWVLVIDADERAATMPTFRERLAAVPPAYLAATVSERSFAEMRRLFRADPGLTVEGAHNGYRIADGPWLAGSESNDGLAAAADLTDVISLEHDRHLRDHDRLVAANIYRIERVKRGER